MQDSVRVEQVDRDTAIEVYRYFNPQIPNAGEGVRIGQYDKSPVIQAFARHRLSAIAEHTRSTPVREVEEDAIDAAAKYLRETQQAGKMLTPWLQLPRSAKKKWLVLAEGTLLAALNPIGANIDGR